MSDHEQYAEAAEGRLEELERESQDLGEQVEEARSDWEAKKADPEVPGAAGDPDRAEKGPVEGATYPAKREDGTASPGEDQP